MQIVSLTTDFGIRDYYVAELKASILSKARDIQFVDVSHHIQPYDIVEAAHFVGNVYPSFPENSIHIIAVDIYYQKEIKYCIMHHQGHYFVAPDNGVLSLLFPELEALDVYEVDIRDLAHSSTASVYAHIVGFIHHNLPIDEIGSKMTSVNRKLQIQPVVTSSQIRATIMHVDHYENVIVNVKKEQFDKVGKHRNFQLYYKQNEPIDIMSRRYSDVPVGDVLCRFNSAGYLEIAINMGKASSMLNLYKNETIQINFF